MIVASGVLARRHGCSGQNSKFMLSIRKAFKHKYHSFAPRRWPGKLRFVMKSSPAKTQGLGHLVQPVRKHHAHPNSPSQVVLLLGFCLSYLTFHSKVLQLQRFAVWVPVARLNVSNLFVVANSRAPSLDLRIHLFFSSSPSPKVFNLQSLTIFVVKRPVT